MSRLASMMSLSSLSAEETAYGKEAVASPAELNVKGLMLAESNVALKAAFTSCICSDGDASDFPITGTTFAISSRRRRALVSAGVMFMWAGLRVSAQRVGWVTLLLVRLTGANHINDQIYLKPTHAT
jgi:hypothetical protein